MMHCIFDSSPIVPIQWVKVHRDPSNDNYPRMQIISADTDPQVIDLFTRDITSTVFESQLTVFIHFC